MTRNNGKNSVNFVRPRLFSTLIRLVVPPRSHSVPDRLREDMGLPRSEIRPDWERFM